MNIQNYLKKHGVPFEVLTHEPTYDAQHMAEAVHVSGRDVAKTVLLRADHAYNYIVAVLPANRMIDFEKARAALGGTDLALATEIEMANICPDCEIGALPPFGSEYGLKTVVDESLTEDEFMVFEGNTHAESIRMRFDDYRSLARPLVLSLSSPAACHA